MMSLVIVIIGRNEGERLRRCLESVWGQSETIVYVDSGSTDGSVALARSLSVDVVELDLSIPFSAARARNAGLDRATALQPTAEFVQFVDGDCEMVAGWLTAGVSALRADVEVAAVAGRVRERHPEMSVYNRLCDMEWASPRAGAVGGIAMMRIRAFRQAGGFDPGLIAGEEPELCFRMLRDGWKIRHLVDVEMCLHDAAMQRFGQWWRRMVRAGHASAESAHLHRHDPQRYCVHAIRSNYGYGLLLPLLALGLAWPTRGWSLLLLLAYGWLFLRVRRWAAGLSHPSLDAAFLTLGKFALAYGQVRFAVLRWLGRRSRVIEYKVASQPAK